MEDKSSLPHSQQFAIGLHPDESSPHPATLLSLPFRLSDQNFCMNFSPPACVLHAPSIVQIFGD